MHFQNIAILVNKIRDNVIAVNRIDRFNHVDFVCGRAVHMVPPLILRVLQKIT